MRLIDADKLIHTRFSEAFMDEDGEVLVPLQDVITAIKMAPTICEGCEKVEVEKK